MSSASDGIFARSAKALSEVEPNELKATLVSALFVFILMASYYILRPVRDAMASDWTDSEVSFLWNINFFVSAGIVALYGYAISRVRLRNVVPAMYGFFAVTFITFYFGISLVDDRILVDKLFYLWVSVFALFHVSVFWTFMADTFNTGQAKRLFAIIGAGASAGAIVGPAIPALFAGVLGTDTLMLIASSSLLVVIPLVFYIYHLKGTELGKVGMPVALALMPVLVCAGLLILAFAPVLTVLLALQVFRRGGNYGLTRPAREMLYTKVTKEERFKAKPVIDIVVYRGGDAISGSLFAFLTDGIGLGLAAVAMVGSGIAAVWAGAGLWLGKKFDMSKEAEKMNDQAMV